MPEETKVAVVQRSKFGELLASIGDGSLEDDLSSIVIALTDKIRELGENAGGKPSGKIKLTVAFKYDRGIFEVDADVAVTEPKTVRPRTLMYPIRGGGLSRNNQGQIDAFKQPEPDDRPIRNLSVHQ